MLTISELYFGSLGPITLSLPRGQCVMISGASGSGKTLLLKAIADLNPHQGQMYLNGISYSDYSGPQWRQQVGLLSAQIVWWQDTVGQHFDHNNEAELHQLGFTREVLNWPVQRLSVGESQRLGLLRLLNRYPKVLLLDEPTANLDEHNTALMETLIDDYQKKHAASVLWISHNPAQIQRLADQHWHLEQGQLHLV